MITAQPSPLRGSLRARSHTPHTRRVDWAASHWRRWPPYRAQRPRWCHQHGHHCTESPFAPSRRYLSGDRRPAVSAGMIRPSSLLRAHAPDLNPLPAYALWLGPRVFAGCCVPLLGGGPSRCYLPNLCVEVLGPVPRRASAVRMPVSSRSTSASPHMQEVRRAGTAVMLATSMTNQFRGCSHSVMFRLLYLLGPQVAPTAEARSPLGSRAVYATQRTCGYPARTVVSLRV